MWPASKTTREDAIREIENFLAGRGGPYDWDDFTTLPIKHDPELEAVRLRCYQLREQFPPEPGEQGYCSAEGLALLRKFLSDLMDTKVVKERNEGDTSEP